MKHSNILFLKLCLVFVVIFNVNSFPQQVKTIGTPYIHNFSPEEYMGHDQNWGIVQDKRGVMYFANNEGVVEYDGTSWSVIPAPNRSTIRSLCIDDEGRILVGAKGEFGYLMSDSIGNTTIKSLLHLIPEKERNFNNVWGIYYLPNKIILKTTKKIFILDEDTCHIIRPEISFSKSFQLNGKLYLREQGKGIKVLNGDSLTLLNGSEMFAEERVYVIQPYGKDKLLIGTRNQGFFLYDGIKFSKFKTSCDDILASSKIYSSLQINDSIYAIGTIINGLFFINKSGDLIQTLNKQKGLISNNIRSIFLDNTKNLWLANDFGISKIELNSPISYIDKRNDLDIKSLAVYSNGNDLYVGGVPFLFYTDNFKTHNAKFTRIKHMTEMVWELFPFDNKLFVAQKYSQGYLDKNNKYTSISSINNAWTYASIPGRPNCLIMGTNHGMYYLKKTNGIWKVRGLIKGFDLSCRYVLSDSLSNIWVEVPNVGIYRLRLNEKRDSIIEHKKFLDIEANNKLIEIIDNQIIVSNYDAFLKFDYQAEKFVDFPVFNKLFKNNKNIIISEACKNGNTYFIDNKSIGQLTKQNEQEYTITRTPFLSLDKSASIFLIYNVDSANVFIGNNKGIIHYQPNYKKNYSQPFNALIRKVQVLNTDSVIFGGNFPLNSDNFSLYQHQNQVPALGYKQNSLRFHFSATFFEKTKKTKYRYILKGYEEEWSPWTNETKKEYTKIREGKYTFMVQAMNVYETESKIATYKFEILPPWYRSWWAYLSYLILLSLFIYLTVYLNSKRLMKANLELEKIVFERTNDLNEVNSQLEEQQAELLIKKEEITAQAEMLEKTNLELEKLSIVASETDNAVIIMDDNFNFEWTNHGFERLYHFLYKDVNALKGQNLMSLSKYSKLKEILSNCKSQKKSVNYENLVGKKDGTDIWVQTTITPILNDAGIIKKFIAIDTDITELKQAEKVIKNVNDELQQKNNKLQEMDEFKKGMTSMIVHDLKNPLNSILNTQKSGNLEKQISIMQQSGKQMLNMVLNILDVHKYEDVEMKIELAEKPIKQIILNAVDQVLFLCDQKDISIENITNPNIVCLFEEESIERVLVNLLTNAIKYSPVGGKITVSSKYLSEEFVRICVTDEGEGIAEDKLHLVFQKFGQIVAKRSGKVKSTGIGLAFCKMAAEAHGGTIGVHSTVGEGTTFWFTLKKGASDSGIIEEQEKEMVEKKNKKEKSIKFTEEERTILAPIIKQLEKFTIYETDDIQDIINPLKQNSSQNIHMWVAQIEEILLTLNQKKYLAAIDIR